MMSLTEIKEKVKDQTNRERALILQKFFKTGPGDYGEGDIFAGLTVPQSRKIAREHKAASLKDIKILLLSGIHEERLIALLILAEKFKKASEDEREEIFNFYIANTQRINNWDLVDLSAEKIIGAWLIDKPKDILYQLVRSDNLWERRIAVLSTFYFIKKEMFDDAFNIIYLLLNDKHDLIHKACGWMLREIGKRNIDAEESFLIEHYKTMPRTMLRYAIEKFPEEKRLSYLKGYV
jgi:3-methyladenine DNA glycosylase AlkD